MEMKLIRHIKATQESKFDIWVGIVPQSKLKTMPKNHREYKYYAIAQIKVKGGIKQVQYWYKSSPTNEQVLKDTKEHGVFSKRPYVLAQGCDGTIDRPVHALFFNFCTTLNLNAKDLFYRAYPDREQRDYEEDQFLGEWEGVTYPKKWDRKTYDGLIDSLDAINYRSLTGLLYEIEDQLIFENGVKAK